MAVAERVWSVVVPHHAQGAQQARHCLAAELAEVLPANLLDDVVAVVAEPGGVVRVAWRVRDLPGGSSVEVRVTDGGANQVPRPRVVGPDELDGRGLTIVAALATRWGVDRDGLGQSVWAELSSPPL
jgi:hypothetical protein